MARCEIHEVVLNNTGSGMFPASASVAVTFRDTEEEAVIYAEQTGIATLANPIVVSDNDGRIEGWVETGSYDLVVTTAAETYTQRFEAAPGRAVGDAINPTAYGAVGDSATDDREAFQFAIAALPAGGGTILVPNRTFAIDCSTPLSLGNRSVVFQGEGSASKLLCSNTGTVVELAMFSLALFDNITFQDLTIDGPVSLGAAGRFDAVLLEGSAFSSIKANRCAFSRFSRAVHINPTGNWIGTVDIDSSTLTGYAASGDHASSAVRVTTASTGTRNKRVNIRNSSLAGFGDGATGATHGIDVSSDCDLNIHDNDFVSSLGTGYCVEIDDSAVTAGNAGDQRIHDNHFAVGLSCSGVGVGGVARARVYNNTSEVSTPLVHVHAGTPDVDVSNNLLRGPTGFGAVNISTAGTLRVRSNRFHGAAAGATAQVFAITTPAAKLEVIQNDFSQASGASVLLTSVPTIYNERNNYGSALATLTTAASAAALPLPAVTANGVVSVTGTTTVTSMTVRPAGTRVTLIFADVLTFTDGANLALAGDFVTTDGDTIDLISDGTNWVEVGRSVN